MQRTRHLSAILILLLILSMTVSVFAQEDTATEEPVATEEATAEAEATEEPAATEEAVEEEAEATEEPAAEEEAATGETVYVIQPGDTLYRIATNNGLTVSQLAAYNNIMNTGLIYWGQSIRIPSSDIVAAEEPAAEEEEVVATEEPAATEEAVEEEAEATEEPAATEEAVEEEANTAADDATYETYTVVSGDNLYRISLRYGTTVENLITINDIQNANLIFVGQELRVPAAS